MSGVASQMDLSAVAFRALQLIFAACDDGADKISADHLAFIIASMIANAARPSNDGPDFDLQAPVVNLIWQYLAQMKVAAVAGEAVLIRNESFNQ